MATNQGLLFDPRYQTFEGWASLLCEQYASQQLAIPSSSTNWQEWGAGLLAIDIFTNEAAPSPYLFNDWQEWAAALLAAMNP